MAIDPPATSRFAPELLSLARLIFGFLLFRHGMEQVIGFPPAWVATESTSAYGVIKLLAFPGGILIMLGLFLRPVCAVLSALYLVYWFIGPLADYLAEGQRLFGARGPSDPVLLNGMFLLYLAFVGGGAWSADRWLAGGIGSPLPDPARPPKPHPGSDRAGSAEVRGAVSWDSRWAPYVLGALRVVAAFLFIHHGLDKVYGRVPLDVTSLRALAAILELVGGPMLMVGLLTRPVAFLLSGQMAFAYFLNHWPERFWGSFVEPNQEAAILNCFLFLFLWASGPGAWSLDGLRRERRRVAARLRTREV